MAAAYCEHSGKVRYPSHAKAWDAVNGLKRRERSTSKDAVYRCAACGDFHLARTHGLLKPFYKHRIYRAAPDEPLMVSHIAGWN